MNVFPRELNHIGEYYCLGRESVYRTLSFHTDNQVYPDVVAKLFDDYETALSTAKKLNETPSLALEIQGQREGSVGGYLRGPFKVYRITLGAVETVELVPSEIKQ